MANSNKKPTARQTEILKVIVEQHTKTAQPIGSHRIIEGFLKGVSSATVRNEMMALEQMHLLEKTHTSSGRVPSIAGYRLYNELLAKTDVASSIKTRLRAVLAQRDASISEVIEKSMAIISEITSLTSVITESNADELLKRIDFIPISPNSATVIVVTSTGAVSNNLITIDSQNQIHDIAVCVRVFNDRLVDTRMGDLAKKAYELAPLIKRQIKNYESVIQSIVERVFTVQTTPASRLIEVKNLATQPEFRDVRRLEKLMSLLEDATIWKQIAMNQEKSGHTTIAFGKDIGLPEDVAVATTTISAADKHTSLALVGPTRMDYRTVKALLDFLKGEVEHLWPK